MRMIVFLFAFFLLNFVVGVDAQTCSGSVRLAIEPTFASPSSYVTPSAYGLSDCSGTVYFKQDSCSGTTLSSCMVSGTGCVGSSFVLPSVSGTYQYFACIDKNGDTDFNDLGEQSSLLYTVGYNSLPEFDWMGIIQIMVFSVIVLLMRKM